MLNRRFPFVLMALAVVAGAFGAHALRDILSPKMMNAFQTGVLYQLIHGLGLLALWAFQEKIAEEKTFKQILRLLSWGTILFSGSIYLLAFNELYSWGIEKAVGPITPIGGLLMIAGWLRGAWGLGKKSALVIICMIIFNGDIFAQISISSVTTYKADLQWTSSAEAQAYMVVRANGDYIGTPIELQSYDIGDTIGNGQVAYLGNGLNFINWALRASEQYTFQLYGVINGFAGPTYFPLGGESTCFTPFNMVGNYYDAVDSTSLTFVNDLKSRIRAPYIKISYNNYDETMIAQYAHVDTAGGQQIVNCVYSQFHYTYTPPFDWLPISREHTYCHSWMPSYSSTSTNEYADQHHLFPTQQNNANGVRSNHPLGEVVTPVSTFILGTLGNSQDGYMVYEPREVQKGDAARALLYMALRYDDLNGLDWTFDYLNNTTLPSLSEGPQSLETLMTWHFQDLPDGYERGRNDYIQSIQQNRNPFIDHPFWVNRINFSDLSYIAIPNSLMENQKNDWKVLDNGGQPILVSNQDIPTQFVVYNEMGTQIVNANQSSSLFRLQDHSLATGCYVVRTISRNGVNNFKLFYQHQ
ncbi:MAG: hypothetical protein RL106_444 [Bacteroidota bacterium]|jgi:uncharacterized membrane protein YgdD (TMEM256/DUF423 family)